MSEYIHKSHNVTILLYHLVLPAKYRRVVFDEQVDEVVKDVCLCKAPKVRTIQKWKGQGRLLAAAKVMGVAPPKAA